MNSLIDTSMIVEFFEGSEKGAYACGLIEEGIAAVSLMSMAEFSDISARKGRNPAKQLSFLRKHVRVLPLSIEVCEQAGAFKAAQRKKQSSFGLLDALIYLTAQEQNLTLITKDKDFAGLKNVIII